MKKEPGVPLRTCSSCRTKKPKHELLRFVWRNSGIIEDAEQKMQGRGAYCCNIEKCVQRLIGGKNKWKRMFRL